MYKRNIILFLCMCCLHANISFAGNIQKELNNNLVVGSNVKLTQTIDQDTAQVDSTIDSVIEGMINLPFRKSEAWKVAGAVTVLNPTEILKYDNVTDLNGIIDGRIPGLMGGINLRGLGDALVLIDGIPRPINSVRAEEIEQITVLKDANAAILYGAQARNGIIQITTQKGKVGKKEAKITVEHGYSKPSRLPNYLGAADYMELYDEALINDGLLPLYSQEEIQNTRSGMNPVKYPDANYFGSGFLKNYKPQTRVVAEFSGGKENAQYYINAGFSQYGSLLEMGEGSNEKDQRFNIRSNLDFRINSFIRSYLNIVAVFDISRRVNGDYWTDASTLRPNLYPPLIDTALVTGKEYVNSAKLVNGKYMLGGTSSYLKNVWGNLILAGHNTQYKTSVQFTNGIEFDLKSLVKGLKFNTYISLDSYNQYLETQNNTYAVYEPTWDETNPDQLSLTKLGVDKFEGIQGVSSPVVSRNFGFYGNLNFNRVYGGKHSVSAMLLAYAEKFNETGLDQAKRNTHLGGNINYVYDNKYIIDFSSALVSSAKLPPSNRVGFSPSLGLGWLVSRENFLKGSNVIDYLKVRASVSSLKTDMTIPRYYMYNGQFVQTGAFQWNDKFRELPTIDIEFESNYNLFYEVRKEFNLGVDALLFKQSLGININVFYDASSDLITQRISAYPDYLGGFYPYENYGENRYKGMELGVNWTKQLTHNFGFEIGASMTFLQTEVFKKDETWEYDYQNRVGNPVSEIFGLEALGLFKDLDDITNHNSVQSFGDVQPGDIKYKDQNGDGVIDVLDEVPIGKSTPDLMGSLNLALRFKGITLFALVTGYSGAQSMSSDSYYWVFGDRKYSEVVLDRWTPETAAKASYPRLTSMANSNNFRSSTYWLYDNSRITINQLQLTYDIPNSLAPKWAKDIQVFLRANNVATFSKNKDKLELNVGSEPQYRDLSLGIKALF